MDGTSLTVGDLFCGAGGFSEGFRQAGFKIAWAVDHWKPALETFKRNHPAANVIEADMHMLNPYSLEKVDVLIGSPPCTHFSLANRGGGGDRAKGLILVEKFLECVKVLKPKFWVMENVPSLRRDLEKDIHGTTVNVNKTELEVPQMAILNAADYGAPQTRRRLFSGDFIVPSRFGRTTGETPLTLADVLRALPDPTVAHSQIKATVEDPVYPGRAVPLASLRDHFEDTRWRLSREEQALARDRKIRDRIYGQMDFPDDINRPCRTITATRTHGSRMTIVVPFGTRNSGRRTLTVRECATVQGFPLSYQFWADSFGSKDMLVGNAVSPPVAFAIARSIREELNHEIVEMPEVYPSEDIPARIKVKRQKGRRYSLKRRFRFGIDVDWARPHRLELENQFKSRHGKGSTAYRSEWQAHLYLGYATRYRNYLVDLHTGLHLAGALTTLAATGVTWGDIRSLTLPILRKCTNGGFTDGDALQLRWSGRAEVGIDPLWINDWVANEVSRVLPKEKWKGVMLPRSATQRFLVPALVEKGSGRKRGQPIDMSVRLAASAIALSLVCERLNNGPQRLESISKVGLEETIRRLLPDSRRSRFSTAELAELIGRTNSNQRAVT